jgi:ZIP family zinc transporter
MWDAFLWGLIATSSLVIGGFLGSYIDFGKKTLGAIMAFGAGVLLSALSFELVFSAVQMSKGSGFSIYGYLCGAAVFFIADRIIGKRRGGEQNDAGSMQKSSLMIPMVLAIILDGVPESMVIGLGIFEEGSVSIAMLAAVFISNLPEAIAGTSGMRQGGWGHLKIFFLWLSISIICAVFTVMGYSLFVGVDAEWLSFIQAFAGGAILMMLANSMIPEAFNHGKKLAGIFTVLGFGLSVIIVVLENSSQ